MQKIICEYFQMKKANGLTKSDYEYVMSRKNKSFIPFILALYGVIIHKYS